MTIFSYKLKREPLAFFCGCLGVFLGQAMFLFKNTSISALAGLGVLIGLYLILKTREKVAPTDS